LDIDAAARASPSFRPTQSRRTTILAVVVTAWAGVATAEPAVDDDGAGQSPSSPAGDDGVSLDDAQGDELSPVRLVSWSAPAGCPSEQALLRALRDELSAAPPTGLAELSVAVAITRRDGEFVLKLGVERGSALSVREVRDRSCEGVILAAALTLAMAVEIAEQVSDKPVEVAAPPPPDPDAPPPQVLFRRGPGPLRPAIRLGYASELGLMPGWGTGIEVGAAVDVRRLRFEVGTSYWLDRSTADAATRVSLLAGQARACLAVVERARLSACLGLEVGSFRGRATGISQTREGSIVSVASSAGVTAAVALVGRWSVRAYADAAVQLRRPAFVILPDRETFQPKPLTARFVLCSEWEF